MCVKIACVSATWEVRFDLRSMFDDRNVPLVKNI